MQSEAIPANGIIGRTLAVPTSPTADSLDHDCPSELTHDHWIVDETPSPFVTSPLPPRGFPGGRHPRHRLGTASFEDEGVSMTAAPSSETDSFATVYPSGSSSRHVARSFVTATGSGEEGEEEEARDDDTALSEESEGYDSGLALEAERAAAACFGPSARATLAAAPRRSTLVAENSALDGACAARRAVTVPCTLRPSLRSLVASLFSLRLCQPRGSRPAA